MSQDLVLTGNGATITITNISATILLKVENGIISPTLINKNLNENREAPVYAIQVPSFMSYKYNTIQPGDSITFESTNKDEILYYYGISKNPFAGISVTVTPNEGGGSAVLIEKTITENGTYNAVDDKADGYSSVTVDIPLPTTGIKSGAVIRDYDGSVIASYTPAQFAALSAYPAQPVHTGLTGQGYNWSLAGAKAYVAKYGYVEVGATYITDDGKTRYYILTQEDSTEITLTMGLDGTAIIDWGDNSAAETITGSDVESYIDSSHTYTTAGRYTIAVDITNSSVSLLTIDYTDLFKMEVGSVIVSIPIPTFSENDILTSITIPDSITSIEENALANCCSLSSIIIPDSITSIGSYTFVSCYALASIIIPDSVTRIGNNAFEYCCALTSIIIPDSVKSIDAYAFENCYSLSSIIIPDSVTSIGSHAFYNCYSLTSITFESLEPPSIGDTLAIPRSCTIYVPTGTLQAYTTASNYPDPTIYTYVEY